MNLTEKIEKCNRNFVLKKMGEDYRHAYELLSIKNLEGFEELHKAPKRMSLLFNKYPETWRILLHMGLGLDPRIEPICKEIGYDEFETELFCHISKKISYCRPISTPSKRMRKLQEKIIDVIKNHYSKKIEKHTPEKYEEYKKFLDLPMKFYSDRDYHLQIMNKFYKEIIPRLKR